MLGEIAGAPRLSRAMALESATSNATRMVGPALGGVLMETLGLPGVYLVGALAPRALRADPARLAYRGGERQGGARARSSRCCARAGVSPARAASIVAALAVTVIVNLWGFAYITMVPVIGERTLGCRRR